MHGREIINYSIVYYDVSFHFSVFLTLVAHFDTAQVENRESITFFQVIAVLRGERTVSQNTAIMKNFKKGSMEKT